MIGASHIPNPSIVLGFPWVAGGCTLATKLCAVESPTPACTGQGMHGSISRADTRNFMAAIGPDFKGLCRSRPISNADINPTLALILGLHIKRAAPWPAAAATEALTGGRPILHHLERRRRPRRTDGAHGPDYQATARHLFRRRRFRRAAPSAWRRNNAARRERSAITVPCGS